MTANFHADPMLSKKALRILHVLPALDQRYGGPLRCVLDLSANGLPLGITSEVLGFGPVNINDNPLPIELIHTLKIQAPAKYCYSKDLQDWLTRNLLNYDGVVLHGMWLYPNWAVSNACNKSGLKYVCFPHGMLEPWSLYGQGLAKATKKVAYWYLRERRIFRGAAAVFFTTHREQALAQQTFALSSSGFIVVPYGVDRVPSSSENTHDHRLAIPDGSKVALFLGRVHPKKNVDFLIRAWNSARPSSEWTLIIAGPAEKSYQDELEALASNAPPGSIRFVGAVFGTDKSYLLSRAAWFLLPSKQENFGVSVLEAVTAGCPVAISDQVYLSDHFHRDSEVLPVEMAAWVTFIRERMPNEEHRQQLIKLDQEHVVPQFSIGTVTKRWVETMELVFAKKTLPPPGV